MTRYSWLCLVLLFSVVGCRPRPLFVNYPQPELTLDLDAFTDIGCVIPDNWFVTCPDNGPVAATGCYHLRKPSDLLGGLEPSYPILTCQIFGKPVPKVPKNELPKGSALGRCELYQVRDIFHCYVTFQNEQLVVVGTEDEFQATFAPIETAEEALSYAMAITGWQAYYGLQFDPTLEWLAAVVEDTHVEPVADGYLVNLFSRDRCTTRSEVVRITYHGEFTLVSREDIYRVPEERCRYVE